MQDRFGNRVIKAMVKADNAEEANDKGMLAQQEESYDIDFDTMIYSC